MFTYDRLWPTLIDFLTLNPFPPYNATMPLNPMQTNVLSDQGAYHGIDHQLSTSTVARLTGRAPKTVRRWIRTGQLKAYKAACNHWFVTASDLRKWLGQA